MQRPLATSRVPLLVCALVAASSACSYQPPGQCKADSECPVGQLCNAVCVSCPGGICVANKTIPAIGASLAVFTTPFSAGSSVTATFGAGAVPDGTAISMTYMPFGAVPPPPNNGVYVTAFQLGSSVPQFAFPAKITSSNIATPKPNTVLLIARLTGGSWTDVNAAYTGTFGQIRTLHPSAALPGVTGPGTYLVYQPAPGTKVPVADFGIALIPDDGAGVGMQVVQLYDDNTNQPLATPTFGLVNGTAGGDLDGAALTHDGSQGALIDGANFILFFSDVLIGSPSVSPAKLDITSYGGDGDGIAILPEGDEVVIAADSNQLLVVSGILSGQPTYAAVLPLPSPRDGLLVSDDGTFLLARGSDGITIYGIAPVTPAPGSLGGTLSHSYTLVANYSFLAPFGLDGRDGMAGDPVDGSRALIVGTGVNGPAAALFTGLPGTPSSPPGVPVQVPLSGVSEARAVAIMPDGKRAIIGTNAGLVMMSGVDTGVLQQIGPPFNPSFKANGKTYTLAVGGVPTLGITLDGSYVVVMTPTPSAASGALLTIPILQSGFGAPVGVLPGVAVPFKPGASGSRRA